MKKKIKRYVCIDEFGRKFLRHKWREEYEECRKCGGSLLYICVRCYNEKDDIE